MALGRDMLLRMSCLPPTRCAANLRAVLSRHKHQPPTPWACHALEYSRVRSSTLGHHNCGMGQSGLQALREQRSGLEARIRKVCAHARTHARARACTLTRTHTRMHTHVRTHTHAHARPHARPHTRPCTSARAQWRVCAASVPAAMGEQALAARAVRHDGRAAVRARVGVGPLRPHGAAAAGRPLRRIYKRAARDVSDATCSVRGATCNLCVVARPVEQPGGGR
jgi:hypothetical protein